MRSHHHQHRHWRWYDEPLIRLVAVAGATIVAGVWMLIVLANW